MENSLKNLPWVEKYRPQNLDQVTAQEESIRVLKHSLKSENLPHLLFYGPPGTGKTSSILALAKELFTPEYYRNRVLELNASDERGISVIRDKVKHFARIALSTNIKGLPPYKLIILDEADSLTTDAQSALRRTMETFAETTRFCLICNYVTRIIEPLASRCAKFRFKPIAEQLCIDRINFICQEEQITVEDQAVELLVSVCNGDLRRGIMLCQSATQFKVDKTLDVNTVREISGLVPEDYIEELVEAISFNSYLNLMDQLTVTMNQGYAADAILNQLVDATLGMGGLSEIQKSKISLLAATCDKNLTDGGEEFLQVLAFATQVAQIVQRVG